LYGSLYPFVNTIGMHAHRARLTAEIIAEFLPPKDTHSQKVMIFCDGMPSLPNKKSLLEFAAKKGYWAFHPRYRGTWESGGTFLEQSPVEDIREVMDALQKPIRSIWANEMFDIQPKEFVLVGGSFGGPAALLLSKDPRVSKVICVSPVVDWQAESPDEPLDHLFTLTKEAFGEAYRMKKEHWDNLQTGTFYNPMTAIDKIDPHKVLLIHAVDDTVVSYQSVEEFAKKTGCRLMTLKKGGHLSVKKIMRWMVYWRVREFLRIT